MTKGDPDDLNSRIRRSALTALTDGILARREKNLLSELTTYLRGGGEKGLLQRIDIHLCQFWKGSEEAAQALERILEDNEPESTPDQLRILIAEFLVRIAGDVDLAKKWIAGIEQPQQYARDDWGQGFSDLSPFIQRIRLNRLLSAFGCPI